MSSQQEHIDDNLIIPEEQSVEDVYSSGYDDINPALTSKITLATPPTGGRSGNSLGSPGASDMLQPPAFSPLLSGEDLTDEEILGDAISFPPKTTSPKIVSIPSTVHEHSPLTPQLSSNSLPVRPSSPPSSQTDSQDEKPGNIATKSNDETMVDQKYTTDSIRAICKAQSLVRGYLSRLQTRKHLMLQAWHELDTKEEQELAQTHGHFEVLREMVVDGSIAEPQHEQLKNLVLQELAWSNSGGESPSKKKYSTRSTSPTRSSSSPTSPSSEPLLDDDGDDGVEALELPNVSFTPCQEFVEMEKQVFKEELDKDVMTTDECMTSPAVHHTPEAVVSAGSPPPADGGDGVTSSGLDTPGVLDGMMSLSSTSASSGGLSTQHYDMNDDDDIVDDHHLDPAAIIPIEQQQLQTEQQPESLFPPSPSPSAVVSTQGLTLIPPTSSTAVKMTTTAGASSPSSSDDSHLSDTEWAEKVQTRLNQLRVLREFREHAVPHPGREINPSAELDITACVADSDEMNDAEFEKNIENRLAQQLSTRGQRPKLPPSITSQYPRAFLRPVTADNPIDYEWVQSLRDELASGRILESSQAERLIMSVYTILCKEPNVQTVVVPKNGSVTIIGDIHGQLADLLSIFRLNGTPSGSNVYIFNGDWVDRGQQSCECLLLLLAWKALMPEYVFLNRGNHEAEDINSRDGFEKECMAKYGPGMFPLFSELFSAVPIAALVKGRDPQTQKPLPSIFVTHGGIPQKGLTIEKIQQENRFHKIPVHDSIVANMLWSDPSQYKGVFPSSRGAGYEFGPDVTLDFLRNNNCCMLIRSHECVDGGWSLSHNNMCVTVFSASNYCGVVGNQGAYAIIESSLRPTLVTFYADKTTIMAVRASVRFKRLEHCVIRKLMDRIATHRLDLIAHFRSVARDNMERIARGETVDLETNAAIPCSAEVISRKQWADGLKTVLGLNIPFLLFQEQLGLPDRGVLGDERGPINFMAFLSPFTPKHQLLTTKKPKKQDGGDGNTSTSQTDATTTSSSTSSGDDASSANSDVLDPKTSRKALEQISQLLFMHRYEVESVFRFLDYDNNQSVSRDEFITGIFSLIQLFKSRVQKMREENHPDAELYARNAKLLLETEWTKPKLQYLADIVDRNNDGEIQYLEFMEHFKYDAAQNPLPESSGLSLVKK